MTRKPAIRDAEAHVITTHGADFFGEDRYLLKDLAALAPWVTNSVSYNDRRAVAPLVAALEKPEERTFQAADVAQVAEQLLKVSRQRHLTSRVAALARSLADAAARAAADGDPWLWRVEFENGTATA